MSENSNKTHILSFRQEISSLHFQARVDAPSFEEALQRFNQTPLAYQPEDFLETMNELTTMDIYKKGSPILERWETAK